MGVGTSTVLELYYTEVVSTFSENALRTLDEMIEEFLPSIHKVSCASDRIILNQRASLDVGQFGHRF
jgi:hypothetical protein